MASRRSHRSAFYALFCLIAVSCASARPAPDHVLQSSGSPAAVIYDARRSATTTPGTTLGASGIVMHVLPAGSRFDPRTGETRLP